MADYSNFQHSNISPTDKFSPSSISKLDVENGEISCETVISRINIQHLCENILSISKEVEEALLREKWASKLKLDEGDGKEQSPIQDALELCMELKSNPECFEGVLEGLRKKEVSLNERVTSLQKALEEIDAT